MQSFPFAAQTTRSISAPVEAAFDYLDDHRNISAHMDRSSWTMLGSRMNFHDGAGGTGSVGSKFGFTGTIVGIPLAVEEVVVEREPPRTKSWSTVGEPKLWVIGRYRMGFLLTPAN